MEETIVTVEEGLLRGTTGKDLNGRKYHSFLGIPYAKPPIGELRFKAPQPPEKWTGIKAVTRDGSGCYSRNMISMITGSENCLFLNVFTPELPGTNKIVLKPVMVWIYGGSFTSGSNDTKLYGPEFLVTEDVVLVTINYRVGVLGFLSLEDADLGVPGNAACKDMIMALTWVQRNIKAFGGDPSNVTIFGESAGGAAVHLLVLSPMAKGLFHKAIAQSGSALNSWALGRNVAKELAEILNCPHTDEKDILAYLQSLPVEKIFEAQEKLHDERNVGSIRPIAPTIEKVSPKEPAFLTEDPLEIILKGTYNKVPLIMGYNSDEGIFFESSRKKQHESKLLDFEKFIPHYMGVKRGSAASIEVAKRIKLFYFGESDANLEDRRRYCVLNTDTYFLHGIYKSVRAHSVTSSEPVFLYRFSVDARINLMKVIARIELPGASHGDELGYLFKMILTPELPADSIEIKTVRRMVKLWANFAKTGDPNPIDGAIWKPVTKDEVNFLDIGPELICSANPEPERLELWNSIDRKPITS